MNKSCLAGRPEDRRGSTEALGLRLWTLALLNLYTKVLTAAVAHSATLPRGDIYITSERAERCRSLN